MSEQVIDKQEYVDSKADLTAANPSGIALLRSEGITVFAAITAAALASQ